MGGAAANSEGWEQECSAWLEEHRTFMGVAGNVPESRHC